MNDYITSYCQETRDELITLITKLCTIPSYSHHELAKAKYIKEWFKQYDINAEIDEANNVSVWLNKNKTKDIIVFSAHIDTVFKDETGFKTEIKNNRLYAPGVGDDTTNVATLMLIVRYLCRHHKDSNYTLLFVFDACEEGLGNLEGTKYIVDKYKDNIKEYYSLDLGYDSIINKAVGSTRYRINIKTEGGHSFNAFGNTNAIAVAAKLINELYQYQVPTTSNSTYNVGTIEGGTSVNTIAQDASFLFEYRSDSQNDLTKMMNDFNKTIQKYQASYNIDVEVIGIRPSMGKVDMEYENRITHDVQDIIQKYTHHSVKTKSGSTDCNVPLSLGIPSLCFGAYLGKDEHTKEEYVELDSLAIGFKIVMEYIDKYLI